MGHNGSGKTTLVQTIAGNPEYKITSGQIIFNNIDITNETPTKRALLGIFLGAQNVPEIPGLTVMSFLKHTMSAHANFNTGHDLPMGEFLEKLESAREQLNIPRDWMNRSINFHQSPTTIDKTGSTNKHNNIGTRKNQIIKNALYA